MSLIISTGFFGIPTSWICQYCGEIERPGSLHMKVNNYSDNCPAYTYMQAQREAVKKFKEEYEKKNPYPTPLTEEEAKAIYEAKAAH